MAVTCSNGHENLDGMTFCEECGVELTALTDRAPAPAPPPPVPMATEPDAAPAPAVAGTSDPAGGSGAETVVSVDQVLVPEPLPPAAPELASAAPVAAPPSGGAYIEVASGPFTGRRFTVTEPSCTLGRWDMDSGAFPEVDLSDVDSDAKISRKHAKITKDGGRFLVEDLGSLNGTSHNRSPRLLPGDQRELHPGDELIVGRLFLRFGVG
ncbi:MAG TPA: FHA domain-containing protein [Propionibacteriaceae bacterium]|jgi:FHA domain